MADIDTTSQTPEPELPPAPQGPALPPEPARHQVLDVVVLVALLGVCAGVYRAVGNAGFSVIIGAVAGLYGTWRMRR
ncbi:hypothetical protein SLUN_01370 [Streptomyces lunaelactis]|uniref:Uncharacterized protein n=1 Tax=Streptomyces lunaelactis TaxID=1535768 RepID=A0A2R4SW52_9ACTN|nr:hypothetical protein [Streptomyces lunaelactis]AVZ71096.1 hypothetical protein SLUN_01370 [Streptomyces lunaelactis]NUK26737.1 hypothetical protein [Streptomyces lunaelactis]NUK88361.1 hypothetical protein [Streptomyces lunaelactis]